MVSYRYRIKDRSARRALRRHAYAVNQVWNWCVARQRDAEARYRLGGNTGWPSRFTLAMEIAGAGAMLGIHQQTVQEVCRRFAEGRAKLRYAPRFRASFGSRRALGWVPFQTQSRRIDGASVIYLGKRFHFWDGNRPLPAAAKSGCFVEDSRGRWYVCFSVSAEARQQAPERELGIDLGLKALATGSDGSRIEAPRIFRQHEAALAVAQRAGNRARAKAINAKIANARRDFIHKATTKIAAENSFIAVGNVNAAKLKQTKMAKSVSDAGWAMFRQQLRYKASRHGAVYVEVDERMTSQTCSCCGAIPGSSPKGMGALGIRAWDCSACGASHDRDVNAAINILRLGRGVAPRADEIGRAA